MYRYRILIVALVLTGCAVPASTFTHPADLYHPVEYSMTYDALYADLFWRCKTPEGGGVHVEGYAVTSTRSNMAIHNFGVRLIARDATGNIVANRWTYGGLLHASNIDPVPFAISVPAAGKGVRYDLHYQFQKAESPGSRAPQPPRRVWLVSGARDVFGTIEDVCDDKYRRKAPPPGS